MKYVNVSGVIKNSILVTAFVFICSLNIGLFAQSQDIDPRIYNHYSNQQVDEILSVDPVKIKKMNFYFRSSYQVLENTSCNQCAAIDFNAFDVTNFEKKRMKDRRVKVTLGQPCHVIELLSQTELLQAYQNIQ
jgi:hypothetical protein